MSVRVLNSPVCTPDLSPTESVCCIMKRKVEMLSSCNTTSSKDGKTFPSQNSSLDLVKAEAMQQSGTHEVLLEDISFKNKHIQ